MMGWIRQKQPVSSSGAGSSELEAHQGVHHAVEIVEERQQIKAQFAPGLLLAVVENVGVHHADRVIHDL